MIPITISPEIRLRCPALALGCLYLKVEVAPASPELKAAIAATVESVCGRLVIEDIHGLTAIAATRAAYRACGKEPSRYRPSAEALLRRVLSGKGLYSINAVVDLLNSISIRSGYSIGGFDAANIQGAVSLGIGAAAEPYQAIARGALNIEHLPVLRDEAGAFGTPTSDSERTAVNAATTDFLMVFYDFAGDPALEALLEETARQYERYCAAESAAWRVVKQEAS